jgi:hypothetical protein
MSQASAGMPGGMSQHTFTSITGAATAKRIADDGGAGPHVIASYDPGENVVKVMLLLFLAVVALALYLVTQLGG